MLHYCIKKLHGCSCLSKVCLPAGPVSGGVSRHLVGLALNCLTPHTCMYSDEQLMLAQFVCLSLWMVRSSPTVPKLLIAGDMATRRREQGDNTLHNRMASTEADGLGSFTGRGAEHGSDHAQAAGWSANAIHVSWKSRDQGDSTIDIRKGVLISTELICLLATGRGIEHGPDHAEAAECSAAAIHVSWKPGNRAPTQSTTERVFCFPLS